MPKGGSRVGSGRFSRRFALEAEDARKFRAFLRYNQQHVDPTLTPQSLLHEMIDLAYSQMLVDIQFRLKDMKNAAEPDVQRRKALLSFI